MSTFRKLQIKFFTYLIGSCALLVLSGCTSKNPEFASIHAYAKEHAKSEGWKPISVGSFGRKGYSGPGFDIVYRGRDVYEIDEARDIVIKNVLDFVEQHKDNKKLIETVDLKNGQFSYRNIELRIHFYHKGYQNLDGTVGLIAFGTNTIHYWKYDKATNDLILVHGETMNDALRLSPVCTDKSIIYEDPIYNTKAPASDPIVIFCN